MKWGEVSPFVSPLDDGAPRLQSRGHERTGFYRFVAIQSQVSYGTRMCPAGK